MCGKRCGQIITLALLIATLALFISALFLPWYRYNRVNPQTDCSVTTLTSWSIVNYECEHCPSKLLCPKDEADWKTECVSSDSPTKQGKGSCMRQYYGWQSTMGFAIISTILVGVAIVIYVLNILGFTRSRLALVSLTAALVIGALALCLFSIGLPFFIRGDKNDARDKPSDAPCPDPNTPCGRFIGKYKGTVENTEWGPAQGWSTFLSACVLGLITAIIFKWIGMKGDKGIRSGYAHL